MNFFPGGVVVRTPELDRILALPYQTWTGDLAREMTDWLRTAEGEQELWPAQAAFLEYLHDHNGAVGPIEVGGGKTLICFLSPTVADSERSLLLIPAKLVEKTEREFLVLAKHWRSPPCLRILTYEKLSRVNYVNYLDDYRPDLIICDEAHYARNTSAACTKRILRYCIAESTKFVGLSGSLLSNSLMDSHTILALALGAGKMPLPVSPTEARKWAGVVDPGCRSPVAPGALQLFSGSSTIKAARKAIARRISECPGVVQTNGTGVRVSLSIESLRAPKLPPAVRSVLAQVARDKEDPEGNPLTPSDIGRFIRTLACGFWYRFDPTPPAQWLVARRAWKQFARGVIEGGVYDTELHVGQACALGKLDSYGFYEEWTKVRGTYKEAHSPVWVDDAPLRWVASIVQPNELVWVKYRASGERLATLLGVPYFANKGLDERGRFVEDHVGTAVLSTAANREGRNLQYKWHKNLIVTPMATSEAYQQLIGRTHRTGQKTDVEVRLVVAHAAVEKTLDAARDNAKFVQEFTHSPQKLLTGDWI